MKLAHHQSIYRGNFRTLVQVYDFMTQVIDIVQMFKRGFDTSNEKELLHLVQKQTTEEVKLTQLFDMDIKKLGSCGMEPL